MQRPRIDLNGTWNFGIFDRGSQKQPPRGDRIIEVPRSYQSAFADLFSHTGYASYTRSGFVVPEDWFTDQIVLHFDAVNYWCEVWINGTPVGEHHGGYTPFEFRINEVLTPHECNEIALWVLSPAIDDDRFPFMEVPHGKQDWYGPAGGIWQDVYIERRPATYIESLRLTPQLATEQVTAAVTLSGLTAGAESYELTTTVMDRTGAPIATETRRLEPSAASFSLTLAIDTPRPWSPEDPYLYVARAQLSSNDSAIDTVTEHFGMRQVAVRNGELLLNGEPYYAIGALDQDFYPHTGYTPPSVAYLEDQFRKAKAMGLNLLRCHIKIPHRAYLDVADRLGMLVWYDLPNWGASFSEPLRHNATTTAIERGEALLTQAIGIDYNHPSVVIRTIINENWGTDLVNDATHRRWLADAWQRFKRMDPTRLLVDNSACCDNFHVATDIEDFHTYFSMPDHRRAFDRKLAEFAGHPAWTFADDDTATRTGDEVLMLSEFGNWGLPSLKQLEASYGGEPDWLRHRPSQATTGRSGESAEAAVVDPAGATAAFADSELATVFTTFEHYAVASQRLQFQALRYQIQQIRSYQTIRGYVITELTDLHWEANGMLDMARNPKSHFALWKTVNAPDLIVPRVSRYTSFADQEIAVQLSVSHFSSRVLDGGAIHWSAEPGDQRGTLPLERCPRGEVSPVGTVSYRAATLERATTITLHFTLTTADGAVVNRTTSDVGVYPRLEADSLGPVYCRHDRVAEHLRRRGAYLTAAPAEAELVILDGPPTAQELQALSSGQTLIVALHAPGEYTVAGRQLRVVTRDGVLAGDWATNNNWIAPNAFPGVLGDGLLGFASEGIAGELVIERGAEGTILAGLVVGWAYHGGAYCLTWQTAGGGRIVALTVPIEQAAEEPALSAFLGDLMRLGTRSGYDKEAERM